MSTHMDQLAEWYESAERITKTNLPNDGDTIIYPGVVDGSYVIEPDTSGWGSQIVFSNEECRILHRAPAPKPAWHDAVAVTATATDELGDEITAVWVREGDELWCSEEGGMVLRDDLRDVTPLIEQKVTQPMIDRARAESMKWDFGGLSGNAVDAMLTAALGLGTA